MKYMSGIFQDMKRTQFVERVTGDLPNDKLDDRFFLGLEFHPNKNNTKHHSEIVMRSSIEVIWSLRQ